MQKLEYTASQNLKQKKSKMLEQDAALEWDGTY